MIVSANSAALYGPQAGSQDRRVQQSQRVQQRSESPQEPTRVEAVDESSAARGLSQTAASRIRRVNETDNIEDANYERLFSDDRLDPRSRQALGSYYSVEANTVLPSDGGELVGLDVFV